MALTAMEKEWLAEVEQVNDQFITMVDGDMSRLLGVWNARTYTTGITTADIQAEGRDYDEVQLEAVINMFSELLDFYGNAAVTQGDYKSVASQMSRGK